MGRSFKKVPSIKKPKETGYNKKRNFDNIV